MPVDAIGIAGHALRQDGTPEAIFVRHMGAEQAPAMLRYSPAVRRQPPLVHRISP